VTDEIWLVFFFAHWTVGPRLDWGFLHVLAYGHALYTAQLDARPGAAESKGGRVQVVEKKRFKWLSLGRR